MILSRMPWGRSTTVWASEAGGGRWHQSAVGVWSRSSLERAVRAATEDLVVR